MGGTVCAQTELNLAPKFETVPQVQCLSQLMPHSLREYYFKGTWIKKVKWTFRLVTRSMFMCLPGPLTSKPKLNRAQQKNEKTADPIFYPQ